MADILPVDFGEGKNMPEIVDLRKNMPEVVEKSFWMGLTESEVVFIFIGSIVFVSLMIFMYWVCDCFIRCQEKRRMRQIEEKYEVEKSQMKVRNDRSHVRVSMSPIQMRFMDDLKPQDHPYNMTTSPIPRVPLYTFVRK